MTLKVTMETKEANIDIITTSYFANGNEIGSSLTSSPSSRNLVSSRETEQQEPGWRDRIRRHASATTVLDGTKQSSSPYSIDVTTRSWTGAFIGQSFEISRLTGEIQSGNEFPSLNDEVDAEAHNKAQIGFYKRCKEATQALSSGTFIGELKETISMIRNPAKSIRESIPAYVRTVRNRARGASRPSASRIVAESWLEWKFGVVPLLSDIDDGARALATLAVKQLKEYADVSYTGTSETSETEDFSSATLFSDKFHFRYYATHLWESRVRYRGQVYLGFNTPGGQLKYVGVSLDDFVPTIWELLPWSFLIDYFSNIGDVILSWSYANSNIAWCNRTFRRRALSEYSLPHDSGATQAYLGASFISSTGTTSPARLEVSSVHRDAGLPGFPDVRFEIPGLGDQKWLNIAALARLAQTSRLFP